MDILYGFAQLGQLVDNTDDVVAPVGELSSYSLTFARDKLIYTNVLVPNLSLVQFFYERDGEPRLLSLSQQHLIIEACSWVYTQARNGALTEDIAEFQVAFLSEFSGRVDLVDSGPMANFGSNRFCPEYINIAPAGLSRDMNWTLWLSDEAFRNQCPISTILSVGPIDDLDGFFGSHTDVHALAVPPDIQRMNDKTRILSGDYPYTDLRTWKFDWNDPTDESVKVPTYWITLHHGDAGNNIDQAKEALRNFILANSNRGREEWARRFPDIFTSTEFIIIPGYDLVAVPSKSRQPVIYSPTSSYQHMVAHTVRLAKGNGYSQSHIETVLEQTTSLYRSLSLAVVGGFENRDGVVKFSQRYPDYINVPTTHVDFGYMTEPTREFVLMLSELLSIAESTTPSSSIPRGYNRIHRDGVAYISMNVQDFLYLAVTKYSFVGV